MSNTMSHEQTSVAIYNEVVEGKAELKRVSTSARQGDVIVRRVGNAKKGESIVPEPAGLIVAMGNHGQHRLHAKEVVMPKGTANGPIRAGTVGIEKPATINLPHGGVMVHTDSPDARHPAMEFAPGCWEISLQREVGMNDLITRVQD